jgi:hypothetical protein
VRHGVELLAAELKPECASSTPLRTRRERGVGRRNGIEIVVGIAPGTPFAQYCAGALDASSRGEIER